MKDKLKERLKEYGEAAFWGLVLLWPMILGVIFAITGAFENGYVCILGDYLPIIQIINIVNLFIVWIPHDPVGRYRI